MVHGACASIRRAFGALVDLQPMSWGPDGLVCAPWLDPQRAAAAIAVCPFPLSPTDPPPAVPDTPARLVAGWYRRTNHHAPAPAGTRELVQVAGSGFGPHDHPTTAMCLASLDRLPAGPAVDVGCGSGLLTQAWCAMGNRIRLALDADPGAVTQTRASLHAAALNDGWQLATGRIESLPLHLFDDAIVLANLPPIAHAALVHRIVRSPRALVLSGMSRPDSRPLVDHYRTIGLRVTRTMRSGRYVCITMVQA